MNSLLKFRNTRFWKNYDSYDRAVKHSTTRCTVDAIIYWRLLNSFHFTNFLEIGVFQGITSGLFFESNEYAIVDAIDPVYNLDLFYKYYSNHIDNFNFFNKPSMEVSLERKYDFALIDGMHDYTNAMNDIDMAMCHLTHNAVLAIDDYKIPGVSKALDELHKKNTDWVPFLQAEQTQFWHNRNCDRNEFLDNLLVDDICNFIFINNITDTYGNLICSANTLSIFTDDTIMFNLALEKYNI